jgi:hypothetical protein
MARGRVIANGSPAEIVTRFGAQNLEETFLSVAAGHDGAARDGAQPREEVSA